MKLHPQVSNLIYPRLFPQPLEARNFKRVFSSVPAKGALPQFVALFVAIYGNCGGSFKPLRREADKPSMFFNSHLLIQGGRVLASKSYNAKPNKLAGNQLKIWGAFSHCPISELHAKTRLWNGQMYPNVVSEHVEHMARNADFYKFRPYGYLPVAGRKAYEVYVEPVLAREYPEKAAILEGKQVIDALSNTELDQVLTSGWGANEIAGNSLILLLRKDKKLQKAFRVLEKAVDFAPFAYTVAGEDAKEYVEKQFIPRCQALLSYLRGLPMIDSGNEGEIYAIDGYSLSKPEIRLIQITMLNTLKDEQFLDKLLASWEMEGYWGDTSEEAFRKCKKSIKYLQKVAPYYF